MKYKKIVTISIIFFLLCISLFPSINSRKNTNTYECERLDASYIYNITKALSYIIFTEYNESAGELAKGRFFGSKGEHKAAEILAENMTELGLNVTVQKIENTPEDPKLTHIIDIIDYGLKINNKTIEKNEFHIAPSQKGPRDNPDNLNYNFSFDNLLVIPTPDNIILWTLKYKLSKDKNDFVFIDSNAHFNITDLSTYKLIKNNIINPLRSLGAPLVINKVKRAIQYTFLYNQVPQFKGEIGYDLDNKTYNMGAAKRIMPLICINYSLASEILEDLDNATIDFYINQSYNDSVESYNVIGRLDGKNPDKTVVVDCLYDSWWCQGTADSGIGMAMVLGVAKYFKDNNITPEYNMEFIAFGGEEVGFRGSLYYEYINSKKDIIYVIDLNQLGFRQNEPKLDLNIISNKLSFLCKVWKISKETDYVSIVNNTAGIIPLWMPKGAPSDDSVFALKRPLKCKTVCFLKSYYWANHHRDGINHTEGDVLKYFDWADVNATGEIVLKVTKNLVGVN